MTWFWLPPVVTYVSLSGQHHYHDLRSRCCHRRLSSRHGFLCWFAGSQRGRDLQWLHLLPGCYHTSTGHLVTIFHKIWKFWKIWKIENIINLQTFKIMEGGEDHDLPSYLIQKEDGFFWRRGGGSQFSDHGLRKVAAKSALKDLT